MAQISVDERRWRRALSAILLMVGASAFFAVMGACVKASTAKLPFLVAVFFRSAVGLVPLIFYFYWTHRTFRATQHGLIFLRSVFGFTAMCLFFLAIDRLRLATATVLNFTSPIFVVLLSAFFLKEKGAFRVLPIVVIAFIGVAIMVVPEFRELSLEVILGLASAFLAAMAYVTIKRLSRTESSPTIVLYFSLWSTLFALVALLIAMTFGWSEWGDVVAQLGNLREVLLLCGVGFCGTFGQIMLTAAYSREKASIVSPFSYLSPIFSYLIGAIGFGETPTWEQMLGGAVVIAASIRVVMMSREAATRPDIYVADEGA